jgi:DNA-binding PadR family transcriptional regulator
MPTLPHVRKTDHVVAVVSYLDRHDVALEELLAWQLQVSGDSIRKILTRMVEQGLLAKRPLVDRRSYYQLTDSAIRTFRLTERLTKPFGHQALALRVGRSYVAAYRGAIKLKRQEFEKDYSELVAPGISNDSYILDCEGLLGFVIVDIDKEPRALVRKIVRHVHQRRDSTKAFGRLILHRRFFVAVAVATREKKQRVEGLLARRNDVAAPVMIELVPELARLTLAE